MDTKPTWRLSTKTGLAAALAVLGALHAAATPAQVVYSEDFTGANTANSWYFYNGACLTAGTGTSTTNPGLVPGCATIWNSYYTSTTGTGARAGVIAGLPQLWDFALVGGQNGVAATCASPISNAQTQCSGTAYTLPDPVGKGALRFTNGFPYGFLESGAIVSAFTFGAGAGVHITFKTVTYRGDSGSPACSSYDACTAAAGNLGDGADGIGFYLIDASHHTPGDGTYNGIGSWGGSLGYSCSQRNPPFDGLVGGYIGLGIDEYGDYLSGANYVSGYTGPNPINAPGAGTVYGDNTATGYGQKANRIGIRGNGNLSFAWLNANYPTYYPSSLNSVPVALNGNNITAAQEAVYWTCIKGTLWNFSNPAAPVQLTTQPVADYAPIPGAYVELPSTVQIANESAVARTAATPISYDLKITQNGLLSLSYSVNGGAFQSVLTNQNITTTNGALPSLLRFGFAGTAGGHTNIHEILCFKAAPPDTSASSASANQTQASKVASNAQVYYSYYNPSDWTGTVTANALYDTAGVLTVSTLANWDAQCTLSGIAANTTCTNTGVAGATSAEAPTSRVMLSWNGLDTAAAAGTAGEPFEFGNLTTAQIGVLDAGDGSNTANRLNYLRGVRTNEINTSGVGLYRARDGVLGDIVDSSPVWVGPPSSPFALTWKDRFDSADVMPENSGQSYTAFAASQQSRLNVVYVGANDGFLHGFRTGSEDASGNLVANSTTPNDGLEVLAYMPGAVLNQIHNSTNAALDYSAAQYGHAFYVDATPGTGDLYYSGQWHTWLVGGLGAGGSAIYALDVTNPTTANFTESQAANLVQGEWSSATITCVNVASCGNNLGNTYGTPIIRRLHNGTWAAIFGNGYGSTSGDAGIYVMTVSQTSGAKTFYYLSTGTAGGNGIAYVTSADLDGDRITDYVYAGDLKGNVWRFDLTSTSPSSWAVTSPGPLFKTPGGQPITTQVVVAAARVAGSSPYVLVSFGTGQRTQFTTTTPVTYASGTQTLYGVWDWNFTTWNANSPALYASMTGAQMQSTSGLASPYTMGTGQLQAQTFSASNGVVSASNTPIVWTQCGTVCTAGKFGWYANLPGGSEQIVSNPSLYQGGLIVNSTIPANNSLLSCTNNTDTGVTYDISVVTGGSFQTSPGVYYTGFVNYASTQMVGLQTNETGSLTALTTTENTTWLLGQAINPTPGTAPPPPTQIKQPTNVSVNRQTWVELR